MKIKKNKHKGGGIHLNGQFCGVGKEVCFVKGMGRIIFRIFAQWKRMKRSACAQTSLSLFHTHTITISLYNAKCLNTSNDELSWLNIGKRASSTDGGGVAIGDKLIGLAGGLCCDDDGNVKPCENVGLVWSGKKLAIELVGLSDSDPVGDARSDPVDILIGGLSGIGWPAAIAARTTAAWTARLWLRASSALCTKWHRGPYGQKPTLWNVRHSSVLYLGWRCRLRSSLMPWANWHFSPYLQAPASSNGRHSSVLYLETEKTVQNGWLVV